MTKQDPINIENFVIASQSADWRGNLQQSSMTKLNPINIENPGYSMLIGLPMHDTSVLEIPTVAALPRNDNESGAGRMTCPAWG